jgi:transcriptional regulator with XRE-family HTH domain
MANRRKQDPTESAAALFGYKLRKFRDARGLTGAQLGEVLYVSPDLISKIETATMAATFDLAVKLDAYFDAGLSFQELQPLAEKDMLPTLFRRFTDAEARSKEMWLFGLSMIPGLLQCEDQARTIIGCENTPEQTEHLVSVRLNRQTLLDRECPPRLWVLITEYAIRRRIGDAAVHRSQLQHLLKQMENPSLILQIVPEDAPAFAACGFILMSFGRDPDLAYVDIPGGQGEVFTKPERVGAFATRFNLLRSEALSQRASADLIRSILEDL